MQIESENINAAATVKVDGITQSGAIVDSLIERLRFGTISMIITGSSKWTQMCQIRSLFLVWPY